MQFRATIDPKIAKHQRFVIDVYEFKSVEIVKQLQAAADSQETTENTAILAVSHEYLFCIVGTRTYLARGGTYETHKSLNRYLHSIQLELTKQ